MVCGHEISQKYIDDRCEDIIKSKRYKIVHAYAGLYMVLFTPADIIYCPVCRMEYCMSLSSIEGLLYIITQIGFKVRIGEYYHCICTDLDMKLYIQKSDYVRLKLRKPSSNNCLINVTVFNHCIKKGVDCTLVNINDSINSIELKGIMLLPDKYDDIDNHGMYKLMHYLYKRLDLNGYRSCIQK